MSIKSTSGFVFEGAKLECLQKRFMNIELDTKKKELVIREFYQEKDCHDICGQRTTTDNRISLPESMFTDKKDRVIGRPYCIGADGPVLMLQYITAQCKFLRFMVVNIQDGIVELLEDNERYFKREFHSVSPLECHINNGVFLFRLPQPILTCHKWAKVLMFDSKTSQPETSGRSQIRGTTSSNLRDRKFQSIAFHPLKDGILLLALIDELCSKCKFSMFDMVNNKSVHQADHMYQTHMGFFLHQSNMSFSRDGDIVVLCYVLTDSDQSGYIYLYFYDSSTLAQTGTYVHDLQSQILPVKASHLYTPVYSRCDSQLQVWYMDRENQAKRKNLFSVPVPRNNTLKLCCRGTINKYTDICDIHKLPLPSQLKKYMQYEQGE
ncbi:hypothetical protein ACJMK2_028039 [Sinanodonta woodiana]|uniref:SOCS box domain-containing protein n=1 Tax=Sinanodonta woodiana TaxID=1069815 RepID=A0ABD3X9R6_SINWO